MVFDGNLAIKSSSRYLRFVLGKLETQRLKVKPSHQMVLSIFTSCNYHPSLLRRKRGRTDPILLPTMSDRLTISSPLRISLEDAKRYLFAKHKIAPSTIKSLCQAFRTC